ncbi:glutamine synthetase family protein [Collinsella sp. LCP19S3_C6]|uniref:glutamine synthetase family protein n=1 Tax=unclassified Collinsella TaxID=2637548 RepID=UPI0029FAE602|nr:glutamine synthetase family protein [Collinsella sp.]MCI6311407.1 glutamine synthetase family protein [Collinsella sp.]MCI6351502.1 glutamine synthetase family protein [Collinsella sp.]MCI6566279.1 glutamine synthetase family protein [Collinsella sp.]MCI6849480.1 glutamine synthetase family protein [Collinsella sp.]
MNQQNIDYVLRSVEQRDIRFVRLWFVDILGRLKNFAISPEDLEVAFEEGIGFDGSAIEGFATPEEADMLAFPDASTFQILPWRPSHNGVARVFCDVCTPDRKPFAGDPRDALRRMFYKAEKAGYLLNVGAALEYYYFPDEHTPEPLDNVGYFDLSVSDAARDLRRNTVLTLEKMSVPVEYTFHAAGRSQHGISLRHAEALSMSDAITTAKLIIKQQAYESGCHASFMPKPLAGEDGSAMFLHQSLFDHDGNNVFWGEDDEKYHLSDIAKHYMAGILAHAREISAITNPTVNSYKRITTGGDSVPQYATWGLRNRASMVRIPVYKPGKQLSTRIELRSPDPMANPYLVNAVTLAAGLDGIERKLELPPEATAETLKLTDRQMVEAGYTPLPRSLKEALDVFEDSQFMKDALGEHIHSFFLKKKRDEWHKFESTITEWEIKHYLANS